MKWRLAALALAAGPTILVNPASINTGSSGLYCDGGNCAVGTLTVGDGGSVLALSSGTITIHNATSSTATISGASATCVCTNAGGGDAGCGAAPFTVPACTLSGNTLTATVGGNCTLSVNYFCP